MRKDDVSKNKYLNWSNYNYTYDTKANLDVGVIQSCQKEKDKISFLLSINAEGEY